MSEDKNNVRIALRPDKDGLLDDVVVCNVSMFRLEQMSDTVWWMACYFPDSDERVSFNIAWNPETQNLVAHIQDTPPSDDPNFTYEEGSILVTR